MAWTSPGTFHFYKWIPSYWPPEPWQVITYDENHKRIEPTPPSNALIPWWLEPKDKWPYYAPWEAKCFGALAPHWFRMREDIGAPLQDPPKPLPSPNIWPTVAFPKPAGLHHVDTRPDGVWGKTASPSIGVSKVHMQPTSWLEVSHHPSFCLASGQVRAGDARDGSEKATPDCHGRRHEPHPEGNQKRRMEPTSRR
jgi:hypothetical protein